MGTLVTRQARTAAAQRGMNPGRRWRIILLLVVGAALLLSRWQLAPRYLVTFDEINFAFAIGSFNPMLHQPQPPGFPLFVGLLKLVSCFSSKIETVFLIAGLVMSGASLLILWFLGESIAGSKRGIICVLLLLFNPAFWLSALTNPVRLSYAFGASLVALCLWHANRRQSTRWLTAAAFALGFAAGFRPDLGVMMAPLTLWTAFRLRVSWKVIALSSLCFAVAVATWLPGLLFSVGGWRQYLTILRGYSGAQFSATSLLFGASLQNAAKMAWQAVVWSCLGALSWGWALPFAAWKAGGWANDFRLRFLALWFGPGLLFYAIFHVADPDHTLAIVPVTCIVGGVTLSTITHNLSRSRTILVISLSVLLNVFFFFKPISKTGRASTYTPVHWMDGYVSDIMDGVHRLQAGGPLTAVFHESTGEWRAVSYYEPRVQLVVIESGGNGDTVRHIVGNRMLSRTRIDKTVPLRLCGTLAFIDPFIRPTAENIVPVSSNRSAVLVAVGRLGQSVEFRGIRFISDPGACTGAAP